MAAISNVETRRVVGPVTRTDFVRYAGAGGDFNPLHHDDDYAKGLGLPSVFGMGMWTAGLLASFVGDQLGLSDVKALEMRFRSPVWPGDDLTLTIDDPPVDGAQEIAVTAADGKPRIAGRVWTEPAERIPAVERPATPPSERLEAIAACTFEDVVFPVERGKVLEFARAVHATSAVHYDLTEARSAGYSDLVAPLTYGNALAHWSGGDASEIPVSLGLELSRVVHGEQRYRFHRPMVVGDVLTARRRVGDIELKQARGGGEMTLVTVLTEFIDEAGAPVVVEELVMIEQPPKTQN